MDPPTDDDDSDSAASFQRKWDSAEAAARRKNQQGFDVTSSDEEDMYDNDNDKETRKDSTLIPERLGQVEVDNDDCSRSTASTPEVVRVDPPAPSPAKGKYDVESDDSESPRNSRDSEPPNSTDSEPPAAKSKNVTPRNLQLQRNPDEEDTVSPLTSTATPSVSTRGQKKSPFVMSTSRKANPKKDKEKSVKVRMQVGRRAKITREKLYQIVKEPPQEAYVRQFQNNSRNFYGEVISGNSNNGYVVEFDGFPHGYNKIKVSRGKLSPLAPGEEEPEFDRAAHEREASYEQIQEKKKEKQEKNPFKISENEFISKSTEDKATATKYDMKYGTKDDEVV